MPDHNVNCERKLHVVSKLTLLRRLFAYRLRSGDTMIYVRSIQITIRGLKINFTLYSTDMAYFNDTKYIVSRQCTIYSEQK